MIYLKNNTDTQIIFIPRESIDSGGKVVVKHYDEGVEDGIKIGEQRQKDKLLNVYITESGEYQTENGYGLVTVDVQCPDCDDLTELIVRENGVYEGAFNRVDVDVEDTNGSYDDGYNQGYQDGQANCEGGGDCNLEDKWITPSIGDSDENGLIVAQPSDGFDGMSRVVINPSTIYNEGVEQGRNEGGGGSCNLEDKWLTPSMGNTDENGLIVIEEDEGYDGLSRVVLDPSTIYNEGVEQGRNECGGDCPEPTYINPIIVSDGGGKVNGDEGVEVPHFVYGGNTQYEVIGTTPSECNSMFIKASIECWGVDYDNLSEPINVIGAENADWNDTTFGLRIWANSFNIKIGRWERKFPFSYGWHDIEMGYNTENSWMAVDGEYVFLTDENEEYLPYTDRTNRQIMIGAINSENGAFRPFYGSIGVTYIECDSGKIYLVPTGAGKMLEYYNDFNNPWVTLDGQGSYDVRKVYGNIKTFTWLGNDNTSYIDLEATENRVYSPSEYGVDYFRNVNVNVNIPTIQELIKEYYYCPLVVGSIDSEVSSRWSGKSVLLNNTEGGIIYDVLYNPSNDNRNQFRTKEKVRFVQTINIEPSEISFIEFGNDIEFYQKTENEACVYQNLTKIVLGENMETLQFMSTDEFPSLNEIWDFSTKNLILSIFIRNVKSGGTLYLKNENHETKWRNNLPEDWTIIYI